MPAIAERTQLPSFFARYQSVIDRALRAELLGYASEITATHRYHMGWADKDGSDLVATEGKRLRPTIALLGAEAVGGEIELALPAAIALEYIHNFSLVHDDIEDQDRFRHHRPTMWVVWGEPMAIVSGNSMLKVADRAARELLEFGVDLPTSIQAQRLIVEAYLSMIEGQYLDISFENRNEVTIDEYLTMIARKTGALIEVSLHVGGLVAGNGRSDERIADGLRRVGYQFGRLFQIRDDILGVWGSDETGKPVCGDIYNKKKSLPAVHALSSVRGAAANKIQSIYSKADLTGQDVETVLEIMDSIGTYQFCDSMSANHWLEAEKIIDELGLDPSVSSDFRELGDFLVERSA